MRELRVDVTVCAEVEKREVYGDCGGGGALEVVQTKFQLS
jgi:hypothetical protein